MTGKIRLLGMGIAVTAGTLFGFAPAAATTSHPLAQRQVRTPVVPAALMWHAIRQGPHTFYGTIVALRGSTMVIRRRNGRLQSVDVAAAVAHGDFSAPLFIGKMVSVDGDGRNGIFVAAHIFRLDNLVQLPNDR